MKGYSVSNSLTVTIRDMKLVGTAIDAAVAAGSNIAGGIQFSIADSSAYYAEALAQAIVNSKSKAAALAKALGVTIGNPIEVIENGGSYMPVLYAEKEAVMSAGRMSNAGTPVQTGELEVSANITVVFGY